MGRLLPPGQSSCENITFPQLLWTTADGKNKLIKLTMGPTDYGRKDLYSTSFQTKSWLDIPDKKVEMATYN